MATKIVERGTFYKGSSAKFFGNIKSAIINSEAKLLDALDWYNGSSAKVMNIILPIVDIDTIGKELSGRDFYFGCSSKALRLPFSPVISTGAREIIVVGVEKLHPSDDTRVISYGDAFSVRFVADQTGGPAPLTVQFTNLTDPPAVVYSWDFGDGDTSVLENPSHVFDTAGVFNVVLTATYYWGQDIYSMYIMVTSSGNKIMMFW